MIRHTLPASLILAVAAAGCTPAPTATPEPSVDIIAEAPAVTIGDVRVFPQEQVACLAQTAYHEARGEGRPGMAAVVHVVLNRTEALGYPDQPCAVVNQGADGRTNGRCQFSWACDGKSDVPGNQQAYDRAMDVAQAALDGDLADPTDGAVMFHAKRVNPYWTSAAEQTAEIGSHVFYRLDE